MPPLPPPTGLVVVGGGPVGHGCWLKFHCTVRRVTGGSSSPAGPLLLLPAPTYYRCSHPVALCRNLSSQVCLCKGQELPEWQGAVHVLWEPRGRQPMVLCSPEACIALTLCVFPIRTTALTPSWIDPAPGLWLGRISSAQEINLVPESDRRPRMKKGNGLLGCQGLATSSH